MKLIETYSSILNNVFPVAGYFEGVNHGVNGALAVNTIETVRMTHLQNICRPTSNQESIHCRHICDLVKQRESKRKGLFGNSFVLIERTLHSVRSFGLSTQFTFMDC